MSGRRTPRRGWGWPLGMAALLVGGAAANIGLLLAAVSDASFSVERDYYRKALAWDETMAEESRSAALGWSVTARLEPATEPGQARLVARVTDRAGAAVEGATVAVEAFHNARASQVVTARLAPTGAGGYAAALPLRRPGLWELRLRITRGREVFALTTAAELVLPEEGRRS